MKYLWLAVLLAACPEETRCRTFSSTRPTPSSLLVMAGKPQTFSFVFDGPFCELPEGALSVRPTLSAPSGVMVRLEVERLRQGSDPVSRGATIEFDLALPALAPGTTFLQLFVEPAVGALQIPVFVATDRRADAGTLLSFDAPCPLPARTRAGTMFCGADGGFVALRDSQPSAAFPRVKRAIAVGNVVWMLDTSQQLRRYEDRDGGLLLTATGSEARGLIVADEGAAVLSDFGFPNTSFSQFNYDPALGALTSRPVPLFAEALLLDGAGLVAVSQRAISIDAEMSSTTRTDDTGLLGYDAQFLWLFDNRPNPGTPFLGGPANEPSRMVLLRRPVRLDGGEAFTTTIPPGWAPAGKGARLEVGGELPPLLYSLPDAGVRRTVLLRQTSEGTTFDVLPADPVSFSRDWLIFAGSTSRELRLVPLPLSP
ncbi:MAG: hypothetical protein Q8N26_02810 [Myxococcales bacterium]|nr:hypothetical protein [Myxococcales bacterium]